VIFNNGVKMNGTFDMKLFLVAIVLIGALTVTIASAMNTLAPKTTLQKAAPLEQPVQQPSQPLGIQQQNLAGGCGV